MESIADQPRLALARTDLERGPEPGLTLTECHAAGCSHAECLRAATAHARLPVPAAGTARRLQALSYMGHTIAALAAKLREDELKLCGIMHGKVSAVRPGLAAAAAALYDALWDVPGPSGPAVEFARRHKWAPPLAWDDNPEDPHFIDNPDAGPADWKPRRPTIAQRAETVSEVLTLGVSRKEAARRLSMSPGTLGTILSRAQRAAREVAS